MKITVKPDDYWEEMVPESIRERFPHISETIDCLCGQPENKEAALSLFWKIYDLSKKQLLSALVPDIEDKLDNLERKLNRELREELQVATKDICEFLVYLHVAGSLIIALETTEHNHSERFRETAVAIDNLWNHYHSKLENLDEHDPFYRSAYALAAIISIRLFVLCDGEGEWEEALENLAVALRASKESNFWITSEDINTQVVVDTFEKLWNNPSKVTRWQKLASYCEEISQDEMFRDAPTKWQGEEQAGSAFWERAVGMCVSRLSRDEYRDWKELEESRESENRLRNYFFGDCWESLTEPVRRELKVIDKLWFSTEEINLGSIFESLKKVTESSVRQLLWNPFVQSATVISLGTKPKLSLSKEEARFIESLQKCQRPNGHYQLSLPDFVAILEVPGFKTFVEQMPHLKPDQQTFIVKELRKPLRDLNRKHKEVAHPRVMKDWRREDVAPPLKTFFGIDRPGILPLLARMVKAADQKVPDS